MSTWPCPLSSIAVAVAQFDRRSRPAISGRRLHLDKVAETAEEFTDLLAERATALGGTPEGRVHAIAESSSLPRYPSQIVSEREHVDALSTALATFGKAAREAIDEAERLGDANTADVFTEISRETD